MANIGPIRVTPGSLIKTLNDKATIDHLLVFLAQLNEALKRETTPDVTAGRAAWVPDNDHEPHIDQAKTHQLPLKYLLRTHDQKTDLDNANFLYPTDIASLLTGGISSFSVRRWIENNSKTTPEAMGFIQGIQEGELLNNYARVEKHKKLSLPDGTMSEANNDGYDEYALMPRGASLAILSDSNGYSRLKEVARTLLEAAAAWQVANSQASELPIMSLKPIVDRVKDDKPLNNWSLVRVFAEALSKYTP